VPRKSEIFLLKLGGSLLTEKNVPFSLRKETIIHVIQQIKRARLNGNLILVHGGGSFGHPLAKEYGIVKGMDKSIKNQIHGLSKTHQKMNELNSYIIEKFLEEKMAVLSIQPSSIFLLDKGTIIVQGTKTIESCLKLGIIPVLYGDIILDSEGSFSILSGDQIILLLCEYLKDHHVGKVIFATDVDGVYLEEEGGGNPKLAEILSSDQLEHVPLATFGQKIDVTGSMRGKLNKIKKICELGISVRIINGLKNNYLYKALKSESFPCTTIHPEFNISTFSAISNRKLEHLRIPLNHDVQHARNYFEDVILLHNAFPEIDFNEVDLATHFFNKKVSAPICIAALTGGHPLSLKINKILAQAAEKENIILSVGSQRAGLIDAELEKSFSIVRDHAPTIPIIGNIGIGQVAHPDFSPSDFNACIEMIKADVMAIHFNPLQELLQDKGDISYKLFEENFKKIRHQTKIPIIAKEVGNGFNPKVGKRLENMGFDGFDVGGAGGTSFAAIESLRKKNFNENYTRNLGEQFKEWGIPTPACIRTIRNISRKPIIATGGLRTGIDIAKSIALGANIGGLAYNFLKTAWNDKNTGTCMNTIREIRTLKRELKSSLWLMNIKNIAELFNNFEKYILSGELYYWLHQ